MIHKGTYDGTIYHNPANRFCIISVKTADKEVPLEARSTRRYRDHLIRFVATGYELPRTDAVELELDGEWKQGKYGMQFQVEQWRQIVPRTKSGVEGYLASGLTAERDACRIEHVISESIEMPCATLADWRYSPFWMEVLEYIKCRSRQAIRSARSAASVERIS